MLDHLTSPILRRAIESTPETPLPWWVWIVHGISLLILLPVLCVVSYTVKQIFFALASIEDQNPPPTYQPLPLNDGVADSEPDAAINKNLNNSLPADQPMTASIRSTYRLLKSHGGYRALFRGLPCIIVYGIARFLIFIIFNAILPRQASLVATLLSIAFTVQLWTAWVHIVITPKSPLHFWQRLPPFRKTFAATYTAMLLYFVAQQATAYVPYLVALICGAPLPDFSLPQEELKDYFRNRLNLWIFITMFFTSILTWFLLFVPAQVVLVRVQASLLPPEEHTIVPFDRSFGGRIEPAVVGGKSYASIKDALATLGWESWKRLYKLSVKMFLLECLAIFAMLAVTVPQFMLLKKLASSGDGTGKEL